MNFYDQGTMIKKFISTQIKKKLNILFNKFLFRLKMRL